MQHNDNSFATKTIVTHGGGFHADDCFGVAVLSALFPDYEVIRTRDKALVDAGTFVVDVGGVWDASRGRFDHHQKGFNGSRPAYDEDGKLVPNEPGVGYASAGLVWDEFGGEYVQRRIYDRVGVVLDEASVSKIWGTVDRSLVQYIDLEDTGDAKAAQGLFGLSSLLGQLNATWLEERGLDARGRAALHDERFKVAMEVTLQFLDQIIFRKYAQLQSVDIVRRADVLMGGRVLHLKEGGMPWTRVVLDEMPDVRFVVYEDSADGKHVIHTVPVQVGSFIAKLDLPAAWAGLRDEQLAAVCGVPDSVFCHSNLFIAGAGSLAGVLRMAELALSDLK